jgi:hypothetical protein
MKSSLHEQSDLKQRILAIDLQLQSVRRTAVLQGLDLRGEWDALILKRVPLAQRLFELRHGDDIAWNRGLLFLVTPVSIATALLLWARSGNVRAVVAGFAAGLVAGVCLSVSRSRRRSREWAYAIGGLVDLTN